jgi:hypothetical protein
MKYTILVETLLLYITMHLVFTIDEDFVNFVTFGRPEE